MFNQFKHFLALSLLITFSFNAFSVDDSQQFNKEAYLDLSKPYQQNNPQPTPKKDNQATTILKEVAGATRTALGSTNSDNTDQLGNKVTTSIKNQAVNKTEGLLNNSVNEFLNAFGAGRSEVSIGGISTKKLTYSLRTIQPLSELNANSKELTFIQAGIASGNSGNGRRATINLGIGHRLLVEDDMAIAGINFFTDYETKSSHKRLSLGLEYQRANFSANINKYHMFSDKKLVNSVKERGMSGYDVKLSGQAPYLPWAKIKGTYYYWDAKTGPNIRGNILGVAIELTPSVSFEFGQENNNTIDAKSYGKLTVKLPLGNKQKFTNFAIANKAFKDSRKMDLGALAWVERSNKIMIERGENSIKFKGLSYKIVTGPSGRNWLDRNIGATKVAADVGTADASTVDNRNAYGEYYSFDKAICPTGFSVPTKAELKKAVGLILNGPTPTAVSTATVLTGFLKLPAAGLKKNGSFEHVGSEVALWTKTKGASDEYAVLQVNTNSGSFVFRSKDDSIPVRCIQTQKPVVGFNGVSYNMITSPNTGRIWLDRNLGADSNDATDTGSYGYLYQWGRRNDGHQSRTSDKTATKEGGITSTEGKFVTVTASSFDWTNADVDGSGRVKAWTNGGDNICPAGFGVPTKDELEKETAVSFLNLPTAGYRNAENAAVVSDAFVFLWTLDPTVASVSGVDSPQAYYFNGSDFLETKRAYGMSVRCIKSKPGTKDSFDVPNNTTEYKTVVFSRTKNVWLDRNLGATRVASSTDTDVEKQASYGTYYKLGDAVCPAGFILPSEKDFKVLIAEIGEGGDMTQKALSSVMALPAAGHANDDRTRGSSIYLRGAGNQVVSISSENSNGDFYKDKAEDGDGIPVRCIQASSSIHADDSTAAPTLTIEADANGEVRAGKFVTFTFKFSKPVFGFTIKDVKIDNGTVKAGTTLTRADTDNTLWTLVVRPAQGRNSGDLKVTVLADSVIGVKANENAAKSHSIGLHTRPTFVSQWVKSASASSNTSLAGRLTDDPESTLGNRQQLNDPNSWIEAKATSINGTNYGAKPNLTLTYRTPIYIQYIVIRETFNTREGGQDVWGIDSKGNEVRLRGTGNNDDIKPENSHLRGFVNDRKIKLGPIARKKGPFKTIKITVGTSNRETPDAVDAVRIFGTIEPPI